MQREGNLYIFDMDGTLFRTEGLAVKAFRETFVRLEARGVKCPMDVTDGEIVGTFGRVHEEIWEVLYSRRLTKDELEVADAILLEEELALLKRGYGKLYDCVESTLETLTKEGAICAVASNGQQRYIEGIADHFGISRYFKGGLLSAGGMRVAQKADLVGALLKENPHKHAMMVGDRSSDIAAGMAHGIHTVACQYGFGSLEEWRMADDQVHRFDEILNLTPRARRTMIKP
ncbi:HAD family hydrolase [Ferroacidibacillus organovorans]|uniref:Haloacid dehalogenase n=1 Tax=Ferroacidibacillus organovorans TaxID=1765683 RepID=A0A853KD91_9BACL|nr:HAD family hydrolase [Ferroacidibacillus organovorans]KYP79659.1 hypothetical protein AYJ22_03625 [Ferroacidibacillus organovorans]OAG94773.1 hypothetical protein AYW79_03165 [Ferroacidibacillus organovorans]